MDTYRERAANYIDCVPDVTISKIGLLNIADKINKWERIAIRLQIPDPQITEIQKNYQGDYGEQKYQMLMFWKKMRGDGATWSELMSAVLEENDRHLANQINEIGR